MVDDRVSFADRRFSDRLESHSIRSVEKTRVDSCLFGLIEVLIGVSLESLRYFEDTVPSPYVVVWELLGRVLLIFGLLKIVEGLTSHVVRHSNRYGPVYTV